jgi:hypothetical protein
MEDERARRRRDGGLATLGHKVAESAVVGTGHTVTIRIDAIKDAGIEVIQHVYTHGEGWFLTRLNDLEGVVERRHLRDMQQGTRTAAQQRVLLGFWQPRAAEKPAAR